MVFLKKIYVTLLIASLTCLLQAMQDVQMTDKFAVVNNATQNSLYDYDSFCIVQEMLQEGQGAFALKTEATMQGFLVEEIINEKCINIDGSAKTVKLKWQILYTPWGRLSRSGAEEAALAASYLRPLDIKTKFYSATINEVTHYKGKVLPAAWYADYEQVKPSGNEIEAAWKLLKERYEKEKAEQEKCAVVRDLENLVYKYSAKKIFYDEQLEQLDWIIEGLTRKQMETVCSTISNASKNVISQRNIQRGNELRDRRAKIAKKLADVEHLALENKKKLYSKLETSSRMSF